MKTAIAVVLTAAVTAPMATWAQQETPCAWVVWIKSSFNAGPFTWEVRDAVPTNSECLQIRQRLWRVMRDQMGNGPFVATINEVDGTFLAITYKQNASTIMEFLCLPSSVDPRPR